MTPGPVEYDVHYSDRVLEELDKLADKAIARGDGDAFEAALREFDRRLRIYPQFGEPFVDLQAVRGQVWNGFVPPIFMRYGVFDDLRAVHVTYLPKLLDKAKPSSDD